MPVKGVSKKKSKEIFILTESVEEVCKTDRKSPQDLKPAGRKRRRSSSGNITNPNKPTAKKPKCPLCEEFDESGYRRHNRIYHSLQCSYADCPRMFIDVPSLSHHLISLSRSFQDQKLQKEKSQSRSQSQNATDPKE